MQDNYPDKYDSNDAINIARYINRLAKTADNPNSTTFIAATCKHELFLLKCLLEDLYKDLPEFPQLEKEWEQKRLMEILKK